MLATPAGASHGGQLSQSTLVRTVQQRVHNTRIVAKTRDSRARRRQTLRLQCCRVRSAVRVGLGALTPPQTRRHQSKTFAIRSTSSRYVVCVLVNCLLMFVRVAMKIGRSNSTNTGLVTVARNLTNTAPPPSLTFAERSLVLDTDQPVKTLAHNFYKFCLLWVDFQLTLLFLVYIACNSINK